MFTTISLYQLFNYLSIKYCFYSNYNTFANFSLIRELSHNYSQPIHNYANEKIKNFLEKILVGIKESCINFTIRNLYS